MQKPQCSTFKIATCITFQIEKMFFFPGQRLQHAQLEGAAIYDKHPPLTTSVWLLRA